MIIFFQIILINFNKHSQSIANDYYHLEKNSMTKRSQLKP